VDHRACVRIVDDHLWKLVKERIGEALRGGNVGGELVQSHAFILRHDPRPGFPLTRAACGGGFSKINQSHYGCSTARNKGTCHNLRSKSGGATSLVNWKQRPLPPRLHPSIAEIYLKKIVNLSEALNDERTRTEAGECIRELIEEIRLVPEKGKVRIELFGKLAALINFANKNPRSGGTGAQVTLVAGARNHLDLLLTATDFAPCVYQKPRPGRNGDEVHQGSDAI
jgi:hypothetical protein